MISFNRPIRLRGIHAAYAQYLTTERGQKRPGGVNIFLRVMDLYMVSILLGLHYNRTASLDDSEVELKTVFGGNSSLGDKKIASSNIEADTVFASNKSLNHIYRVVMLNENVRGLSDEDKIANAFKSEGNQAKIDSNIELMNSFARGGIEILYERFQGLSKDEDEVLRVQFEILDEIYGKKSYSEEENN